AERPRWTELLRSGVAIFDLDYDAILAAMYALSVSAEGDCYLCVLLDPGIEAAALGASESSIPGTAPSEALHTFTLDSRTSRCFFRDCTTLTPLSPPVPVILADPSEGPVIASSSTVLPCPAVPSCSLSGLHLPLFSTNLVSTAALQGAMVTTTTPGGQRVSICTCTHTSSHLATFIRRPRSSLYILATEPRQVAASVQVSMSGIVVPPCPCRLLSHQTLLWHHRLSHPSLPHLRGMHSRLLVSGLTRSLPPLPPSPAPPCLPCAKGWQRTAPQSSSFSPTTAPLQTLHMDVTAALQGAMVTTTTPGGQRVSICTCTHTSSHLATFIRRPRSSLYILATEPRQVAASVQVSMSGIVVPPCPCRLLSHQTLLWHHRLSHPSLPHLRGMHSRLLVSGLTRSLPPLPPSPAPPCLPCAKGWQRTAPQSSSFSPTTAPLQTLHMDVWGPARVSGQGRER
ncbi:unnamed protein product, partial [Closterium sp. NIES-53]